MQIHHSDVIGSVTEQVNFITGLLFKVFETAVCLSMIFTFFSESVLWPSRSTFMELELCLYYMRENK